MLSVAEADRLLAGLAFPGGTETVPLEEAVGRVMALPLTADRDGPPYDRVAMDGYAVSNADGVREWTVRGLQCAGRPPLDLTDRDTAVEVATGAILPRGCDAVIPYEHTVRNGNTVTLSPERPLPSAWGFVRRQGADYRQGEVLLAPGIRLRSPHLHSLASVGVDPVTVIRRPVWALAATGDELVEVRDEPQAWQIRRSNAAAIEGEARAWGLKPRTQAVLPDDRIRLVRGVERLLTGLDVLVLTGGVSAGVLDLVPGVLNELGVQTLFHKVAQRPGKPLWCGRLPTGPHGPGTLVFGLPGNPVSSLFAFRRYVLPWLLAAEGRPLSERRVTATGLPVPPPGTTVFLPWSEESGPLDWKGSGDFLALAESSGFIEIDETGLLEPRYHPWGGGL
jgi:molybdopterin molybdotransferase